MSEVITGHAYQRRATLEITGDTLTWRALRGQASPAENIVTTIHDVCDVGWLVHRWSIGGAALVGLGVLWMFTTGVAAGAGTLVLGGFLLAWRRTHPRQFLVLDLGDRRLVMKVALTSGAVASTLVDRIDRALAGELPSSPPPALP